MSEVTRENKIRNQRYVNGSNQSGFDSRKNAKEQIKMAWTCFKERTNKGSEISKGNIYVEGKRGRARPKMRWLDVIEIDMKRDGVNVDEDAGDRVKTKSKIWVADTKQLEQKAKDQKKKTVIFYLPVLTHNIVIFPNNNNLSL